MYSTKFLHHIHPPTPFPHILCNLTGTNSPDKSYSAHLFSKFVKKKKKWHFCLTQIYRKFPYDISMYICVITQTDSSPVFFLFLVIAGDFTKNGVFWRGATYLFPLRSYLQRAGTSLKTKLHWFYFWWKSSIHTRINKQSVYGFNFQT
jgi:hypothetical protein